MGSSVLTPEEGTHPATLRATEDITDIMIVVDTHQRLPAKTGGKRSLERDSVASDKMVKKPKYCGTIYEAMLAPISPVTTLPIKTVYKSQVKCDPDLQADFLDLVSLGKRAKLERFLEDNLESININQYNSEGLTPLQTVAQEGGETSADIGELLVRFGADVRMTPGTGGVPSTWPPSAGTPD